MATEGDEVLTPCGRMSLVVPFEDVERFMAIDTTSWLDEMRAVRALMPESARAQLDACPDGVLVVESVRAWQAAFDARLGKSLLSSVAGATSEQS